AVREGRGAPSLRGHGSHGPEAPGPGRAVAAGEGSAEGEERGPLDALQGCARRGQGEGRRLLREAGPGARPEPPPEAGALREGGGPRGVQRLAQDRGRAQEAPGGVEGGRPCGARAVAARLAALPEALRPLLHALAGTPGRAPAGVDEEPREE